MPRLNWLVIDQGLTVNSPTSTPNTRPGSRSKPHGVRLVRRYRAHRSLGNRQAALCRPAPEAGGVGWVGAAFLVDLGLPVAKLFADRIVARDVGFELAGIVDAAQQMQAPHSRAGASHSLCAASASGPATPTCRGHVEAGQRGVRIDLEFPCGGERGDAQGLGQSAGLGHVWLDDGDGTILDQPVELEPGVVVLAGGKRGAPEAADLAIRR